ncbi:MAG: ribose 5-phosphate isomerase A [Thaumarchaeota archaeon]|nr:ribose 5-phosphate isomerase A [Nitrososphaerota archaeon]
MEEKLKARAAAIAEALKEIKDGMIIGYGSGTTIRQLTPELKKFIEENELDLSFIPSSIQSKELLLSHGMKIVTLDEFPQPDLVIDSFDQTDEAGNVIKGGGGALLREKVLAQSAKKVIYMGDFLKLSKKLNKPVPLEILEYAYPYVKLVLESWGMRLSPRISEGKLGPIITENGNVLADVNAGEIMDPEELDEKLRYVSGILETGIFPRYADIIIIGYPDGRVERISVNRKKVL